MVTNNVVYNRAGGQSDRFNGGKVFFCGNTIDDATNEENYFMGYLDQDMNLDTLMRYGSPDGSTEKGGDCALTPDNNWFVGGFSTAHHAAGLDNPDLNVEIRWQGI